MSRPRQNARRSRRAPNRYMVQQPVPYRPGRPPEDLDTPRPARFTEQPPSRPIHGPVVRRAMSYLQSALSHEPSEAKHRSEAEAVIVAFNAELNVYETTTLPAYNERVQAYNLQMHLYRAACVHAHAAGYDK